MRELAYFPAKKLARLIHARKLSVTEVMQAFVAQIERVNPKVNAIVTFLPEQALKAGKAMDRRKALQPNRRGAARAPVRSTRFEQRGAAKELEVVGRDARTHIDGPLRFDPKGHVRPWDRTISVRVLARSQDECTSALRLPRHGPYTRRTR